MNSTITRFTIPLLVACWFFALPSQASISPHDKDTVTINLGGETKIVILVKDQEQLRQLQEYDLNQMLKDLTQTLDSAADDVSYLKIEDEEGSRYLHDATIIVEDDKGTRTVVITNDKTTTYTEDDEVEEYHFKRKRFKTRHTFGLDLGFSNWLENGRFPDTEQYNVRPWGSWQIALASNQVTSFGGPFFMKWGINVNWNIYKFQDDNTRIAKGDSEVIFFQDSIFSGIKSSLVVPYVNLAILPMFDFSYGGRKSSTFKKDGFRYRKYRKRGFRVGVGGYVGYRIGGRSKFVFREDGDRKSTKERSNFFLNNVRYGVRAQVGYRAVDLFVNYDINSVFSSGPDLNAISFGLAF